MFKRKQKTRRGFSAVIDLCRTENFYTSYVLYVCALLVTNVELQYVAMAKVEQFYTQLIKYCACVLLFIGKFKLTR